MSKIVCDVCGSSYSETEAQCPICGTAKSDEAKPVVETTMEEQPVKGGKFSKNNTKKAGAARSSGYEKTSTHNQEAPSNTAMIIIVAVLLLAIVAVCVFIAIRFMDRPETPDNTTTSSSTAAGTVLDIPCTGIELIGNDSKSLSFTELTQSAQLNIKANPENTTDDVTFTYSSSDPSIVTVSETGLVKPVARGNAVVTVSYKEYKIDVNVTCDLFVKLELTREDLTLNPDNLTFNLYSGSLDPAEITWTSSDETVATVENGVVTALKNGNITITATFGEQKVTCKVHVKEMDKVTNYAIRSTWNTISEGTMEVGEELEIWFYNKKTGDVVKENVTWTYSNDFKKCCNVEPSTNGLKITATNVTSVEAGISGGYVFAKAEYEGVTYKFIIRVKAAATQE